MSNSCLSNSEVRYTTNRISIEIFDGRFSPDPLIVGSLILELGGQDDAVQCYQEFANTIPLYGGAVQDDMQYVPPSTLRHLEYNHFVRRERTRNN